MGSGLSKIKNRVNYSSKNFYKEFIKKYPNTSITCENYSNILEESTLCIRDFILNNELGFKLPYNLGYIAVTKFKQKKHYRVVDWKNSNLLEKEIPLTNLHSFGYMFKIKLFKNLRIKPLCLYKMNAHRIVKRMLAKNIKEDLCNYMILDSGYFNKRFSIERTLGKNKNKNNG
jgi:hypothetical protein